VATGFDGTITGSISTTTREANTPEGTVIASGGEPDETDNVVSDTFNFSVIVDSLPTAGNLDIAVDEDDLPSGSSNVAAGDNLADPSPTVIMGTLNFDFGADSTGGNVDFAALDSMAVFDTGSNAVTSGSVALVYDWNAGTNTLTALSDATPVFTVVVTDSSTGAFTATLLEQIDHPTAGTEDNIEIAMSFKVTDGDDDMVTGTLTLDIDDDLPIAQDDAAMSQGPLLLAGDLNIAIIIDVSGSMNTTVPDSGGATRLDVVKDAVVKVLEQIAPHSGTVNLFIETFSTDANTPPLFDGEFTTSDLASLVAAITALTANGFTNYEAPLADAEEWFVSQVNTTDGFNNIGFFLSDGNPNKWLSGDGTGSVLPSSDAGSGSTAIAQAVAAIDDMLDQNSGTLSGDDKVLLNAIGMGGATQSVLDQVDNTGGAQIVELGDPSALDNALLLGLVLPTPIVIDVLANDTPGADGVPADPIVAVTDGSHGTVVDNGDGTVTYTLTDLDFTGDDTFTYTIIDNDGDRVVATVTVTVKPNLLVVGSNEDDNSLAPADNPDFDHVVPNSETGNTEGLIEGGFGHDVLVGDPGGATATNKSANVLFVLDVSGSMDDFNIDFNGDSITRIDALKIAVLQAMNDLANTTGATVRVHLSAFEEDLDGSGTFDIVINGVIQDGTGGAGDGFIQAQNFVNGLSAGGFTNYEAGLENGFDWLNGALGGTQPLADPGVVTQSFFISDGIPNRALDGSGIPFDAGNAQDNLNHALGTDGSDEVGGIQGFGGLVSIGIDISDADDLAILSQVDSTGVAQNITSTQELISVLADLNPLLNLADVGGDVIMGHEGSDIIFGDVPNSDLLADAQGLSLISGSGWFVFEALEAGQSPVTPGWDRDDTVTYLRNPANWAELAADGRGEDDTIDGGDGDDVIFGQGGADMITTGLGADIVVLGPGDGGGTLVEADVITDFADGDDIIGLLGGLSFSDLTIGSNAGDATISITSSSEILAVVTGQAGNIDETDFMVIV
jgi:hypothetical protein